MNALASQLTTINTSDLFSWSPASRGQSLTSTGEERQMETYGGP